MDYPLLALFLANYPRSIETVWKEDIEFLEESLQILDNNFGGDEVSYAPLFYWDLVSGVDLIISPTTSLFGRESNHFVTDIVLKAIDARKEILVLRNKGNDKRALKIVRKVETKTYSNGDMDINLSF
jgi:hypothetical protein